MTPEPTRLHPGPTRLKVVTFNTWKCDGDYPRRLEAMCEQMQALDADVFALQECFATLDGSTDTARTVAHHLGMHLHTAPARRKLRWFQGGWVDSFSSLAVLTHSPIPSGDRVELPSSVADGGRVAQICSLEVAGRSVLMVNVHLSHLEGGGALRAEQLRALLARPVWMPRHDIALICGDFNASMDSPELARFLGPPWGLVDAFAQAGGGEKLTHQTPDGQGLNLDQVLCMPNCSQAAVGCISASVVLNARAQPLGVLPSDHAGVSVTFSVG